jgi:hypothetical protein
MSRVLGSSGAGSVRHRGLAWLGRTTHVCSAAPRKTRALQHLAPTGCPNRLRGFSWAYLIAAVASTALITWYCRFFLGGGVRTLMIGAGLTGRLHISLHHVATTGLRPAYGRNRALHRAGNRNVRDAQGGLVRARRELSHLKIVRVDASESCLLDDSLVAFGILPLNSSFKTRGYLCISLRASNEVSVSQLCGRMRIEGLVRPGE